MPPACIVGGSVGKLHTRRRRGALFAHGLMRIFSALSERKGADERKGRTFPKHRNSEKYMGTFGNCPFRYRLPTAIPVCLFQQAGVFDPQTPRRPLTPPQLSAPNRSSKNIAEPVRLWNFRASRFRKSVRGVLQNRIVVGARANAEGGCGFGIPQPYGGCFRCSPKLRIGRAKCDNIGSIENTCYCIEGR